MSWRKGSTVSNDTSAGSNGSRGGPVIKVYPFALALRIRVVQIVCGICEVVMGSVALIEERSSTNLTTSAPAGCLIILASSWSIHRRFHREAGGPFGGVVWSRTLWCVGYTYQLYLLYLTVTVMITRHQYGEEQCNNTLLGLAIVECVLAVCSIVACVASFRIRFIYGSAPPLPPPENANCPRSTSHTAVSMVPMVCNPPISLESKNKNADSSSSENDMEEIILPGNGAIKGDLSPMTGDEPSHETTPESATPANSTLENAGTTKTNDDTPNETKDSAGVDIVVDIPTFDRVPNSVEFNLGNNVTQKSNCNGHSNSTKIAM